MPRNRPPKLRRPPPPAQRPSPARPPARPTAPRRTPARPPSRRLRGEAEVQSSLLDLVDNLLDKGVVLSGDLVFSLAGVDLIYLRLSALFCAADRVYE